MRSEANTKSNFKMESETPEMDSSRISALPANGAPALGLYTPVSPANESKGVNCSRLGTVGDTSSDGDQESSSVKLLKGALKVQTSYYRYTISPYRNYY